MIWLRTWQLGVKSLLLHPLRSLLTVLGIFIGVASVIWLLAIGEGISAKAQQQIEDLGATNIIVRSLKPSEQTGGNSFVLDYGLRRDDYEVLVDTLPTITSALRIREARQPVSYGDRDRMDVRLVGCTPQYADVMRLTVDEGHFIRERELEKEANYCVLAYGTAKHFFPIKSPLGKSVIIDQVAFTVVGVMKPRNPMAGIGGSLTAQDFDRDIYIPISTFWRRFGDTIVSFRSGSMQGENVELSQITFQVAGTDQVMQTADVIRATLAARHPEKDFAIVVPLELLEQARTTRLMFMVFMGLIAAISLVVGGIGIMNIMLATVTERTREIGIRRAIGAKRGDIVRQFLIETVVLSITGGITGILVGYTCPFVIGWGRWILKTTAPEMVATLPKVVQEMEPTIVFWSIPLAFGVSVLVGVVFGLYPAIRAADMDPIEALRHE